MLENLLTETRNKATEQLDSMSVVEILTEMNTEDARIAEHIKIVLPNIKLVIDDVVRAFKFGGRLIYIGAGTSGRLGVLDAVECVPTFGTTPEMVQGILAGGYQAMFSAVEGAEDSAELGRADLVDLKLTSHDIVIGLTASGRTPYVIGAVDYAREMGAMTAGVTCNAVSELGTHVDQIIDIQSEPEIVTGSTRLKAGTAQKMVLNMISTISMIKIGKVYQNLMVDVRATNEKLVDRAIRIVVQATGVTTERATEMLAEAGQNAKLAIVMIKTNLAVDVAKALLDKYNGSIRSVLERDV